MIVAECGVNHFGDMRLALELIWRAKENGADCAKFQLYDVAKLFPEKQIIACGKNWYNSVLPTQLTKEQAKMLFDYGKQVGIEVFFSVFDLERLSWCEEIEVGRYKVASNQKGNSDLINAIKSTGKPFLVSSDEPTIYDTLYCIPKYPTRLDDLKFSDISFEVYSGFSDHTVGTETSMVALARGAKIIEKHFCLTRERDGVDIPLSITPDELRQLVDFAKDVGWVL